jgi:hypothetical protein
MLLRDFGPYGIIFMAVSCTLDCLFRETHDIHKYDVMLPHCLVCSYYLSYPCFIVLYVCFLFCVLCFVYLYTEHCHRVETQLKLINLMQCNVSQMQKYWKLRQVVYTVTTNLHKCFSSPSHNVSFQRVISLCIPAYRYPHTQYKAICGTHPLAKISTHDSCSVQEFYVLVPGVFVLNPVQRTNVFVCCPLWIIILFHFISVRCTWKAKQSIYIYIYIYIELIVIHFTQMCQWIRQI